MGRKKFVRKREILPDPKFNDIVVTKFISNLLQQGKKSTAEAIFYGCVDIIQERTNDDGVKTPGPAAQRAPPPPPRWATPEIRVPHHLEKTERVERTFVEHHQASAVPPRRPQVVV